MPMNPARRGAGPDEGARRTYRQPTMLITGLILTLACVVILVMILVSDGFGQARELLWPVAGLLVVWVVFIRPCVVLDQAGVRIKNLVRDVFIGWPAVSLVEQRWNLKIFTPNDEGYGSWAIAAQRPKRPPRSGMGGMGMGLGGARATSAEPSVDFTDRPASSAGVADAIRRAKDDYEVAVAKGVADEAPATAVVRPAIDALVALAAALVCILIAVV
ncbi:hypothetical protein HJ588_12730 [Flexivirga sp. ID2601S]|uniref:PH domain-containing protein n=1 Tax=Flexivirga aerilata TaxID=1656889 RepID=A0A849AIB1_9MICO|nr:hypothetical protein [Flexivirga aerilata]NNG40129.1 hypothetical protein [Flexivirga aerilata]